MTQHGSKDHKTYLVNHAENHRRILPSLFNNPEHSDVVILTQRNGIADGHFLCHKVLLSLHSSHFRALFKSGMLEATSNKVVLEDFDADAVRKTLLYCYNGEVLLDDSDVESVFVVADFLGIADLTLACEEMVKKRVGPDNLSQYLLFAERYNLTSLIQLCHAFLIDNFCKVVQESDFLSLPYESLRVALQSDSLTINSEYEIYEAVVHWLRHDPEREHQAVELLRLVRYPTMPMEDLCRVDDPTISKLLDLQNLVNKAFRHVGSQNIDVNIDVNTEADSTYRRRTMQTGRDFEFCMKEEKWTVPTSGHYHIKASGAKASDGMFK
eukprot:jgi/Botrbrau1/12313/Bobra.0205s0011.1